jgi:hypothetical protein
MAWALMFLSSSASAGLITLIDENSVAKIDTQSQAGFYDWFVDGIDHMYQEWFWLGVGNNPEVSVDPFWISDQVSDTDLDGNDDTLVSVFRNPGVWEMKLRFSLLGSNLGYSDMAEQIRVTNLSQQTQLFRLYEYTDFDLNASSDDDWGGVSPPALAEQEDLDGFVAQVSTTPFNFWEMDVFPNILNKLNDGVADTLPNATSPLFGPKDITFALQWNRSLAPGREFIISKDKIISAVPEPSSVVLLGLGGMALACLGLRRRVV